MSFCSSIKCSFDSRSRNNGLENFESMFTVNVAWLADIFFHGRMKTSSVNGFCCCDGAFEYVICFPKSLIYVNCLGVTGKKQGRENFPWMESLRSWDQKFHRWKHFYEEVTQQNSSGEIFCDGKFPWKFHRRCITIYIGGDRDLFSIDGHKFTGFHQWKWSE